MAGSAMLRRTKNRTAIGEGRRRLRAGEVIQADRNGVFRAQAEFRAGGIAGQIEAAPEILAGAIEKNPGGLQQPRFAANEAGADEILEDGGKALARAGVGGVRVGHAVKSFSVAGVFSKRAGPTHPVFVGRVNLAVKPSSTGT